MLSRLIIEQAKSLIVENSIPFAPITVIAGTNSSGKSTLFQALLLLKQAFESPPASLAGMYLNGRYVTVGSYEDWSSKHERGSFRICLKLRATSAHGAQTLYFVQPFRSSRPVSLLPWWADTP